MKKHFIICLLIALSLTLIGCADKDFDTSPEFSSATEVPTQIETENAIPSESEEETKTDELSLKSEQPTEVPPEQPTEQPTEISTEQLTEVPTTDEACLPFHWFNSIQDLHTFATTLSTDPNNYQSSPTYGFEMLKSYYERKDFANYQPIDQYFDIDEEKFDSVEAGFGFDDNGNIQYGFCLDDIFIWINHVESDSISKCYVRNAEMESADKKMQDYSSVDNLQNGHVLRSTSDKEVIYYVKDGIKREIHFLIGNAYIRVYGAVYFEKDAAKIQEEILTNPKYACFAALFSEDDETFNNTLAKIKAVK